MKKFVCLLLFSILLSNVQSQIINTYAGNGVAGYSGDGVATAAEIYQPQGGTKQDAAGNLYIADNGDNRVRMVNSSGVISTIAGKGTGGFSGDGGQATNAELSHPADLAVDASGNIYIADGSNNRIRKVNTSGVITTVAGNGVDGWTGDGGAATAAEIGNPDGIAFDAAGNMYIGDHDHGNIRMVNTSGIISTIAGNGVSGYYGDGGPATAAEVYGPGDIVIDNSGNIYIADALNHRVRMVNTSGIISTFAGNGVSGVSGNGGPATAAELEGPTGVEFDASGNLYIVDATADRISKVNTSGVISKVAGYGGIPGYSGDGGQATAAELNTPHNAAFDYLGNLYIADNDNNRIRIIYFTLTVSATVTTNVSCNGGSDGSATSTVANGTTPYNYSWSTGGINPSVTGLTAGIYTLTVTDADGVTGSSTVTIIQPDALNVSANTSSSWDCSGGSDTLKAIPSGGTSPYAYSWSPTGSLSCSTCQNPIATPTTTTTYTVTVTDNNGCTSSASVNISTTPLGYNSSNALAFPTGSGDSTDFSFNCGDTIAWISFVADSATMAMYASPPVFSADAPYSTQLHSINLYSLTSGTFTLLDSMSIAEGNDTLPLMLVQNGLIRGNTYYLKVRKYNSSGSTFGLYLLNNKLYAGQTYIGDGDTYYICIGVPYIFYLIPNNGDYQQEVNWIIGSGNPVTSVPFTANGYTVNTFTVDANPNCYAQKDSYDYISITANTTQSVVISVTPSGCNGGGGTGTTFTLVPEITSIEGPTTFCETASPTFTCTTAETGINANGYTWVPPSNIMSGSSTTYTITPSITNYGSGTISVSIGGCPYGSNSNSAFLRVTSVSDAGLSATGDFAGYTQLGVSCLWNGSVGAATGPSITYQWSFTSDFSDIFDYTSTPSTGDGPFINSDYPYTFYVRATNACTTGASTTYSETTPPAPDGCLHRPINHDTLKSDGLSYNTTYKVYPNPAYNQLIVEYPLSADNSTLILNLYDILGQKITSWGLPSHANNVSENISELPSGIYEYVIYSVNSTLTRGKLIVQR